jgi:hypothetical protein
LHADAFSGFDHLYRGNAMVEAGCIGHARRKLVDLVRAKGSPVAAEGVKQIPRCTASSGGYTGYGPPNA